MLKNIICKKYHSFGNSFIILDETENIIVNEKEKPDYARQILNYNTGIGADGLIVLTTTDVWLNMVEMRPLTADKLYENNIDCIFRHFEPDGTESFMCINGLLVSGMFISEKFDKHLFNMLASTNSRSPQLLRAGFDANMDIFVEGLHSYRVDQPLADPNIIIPFTQRIDRINPIELIFRKDDINNSYLNNSRIMLSGYLLFSGEPHLVILTDQMNISDDQRRLTDLFFNIQPFNRRAAIGDRLIHTIGMRVQNDFKHLFPMGLNITFVHLRDQPGTILPRIEYRCFERAINKETLSCGTGALAAACVVQALNLTDIEKSPIYPYRYNREQKDSYYIMAPQTPSPDQWRITGKPELISDNICF